MNKEINIVHMFPDLLNVYGDKGNISALEKRLEWRNINANTEVITAKDESFNFENADIIFIGGGLDREQTRVCDILRDKSKEICNYVESGGVMLAVCGAYPMLGKYFKTKTETVQGLSVLDIYTENQDDRLIGDIVVESDLFEEKITGFENHGGRTFIGDYKPLGKVVCGYGNTENSGFEGVVYKNLIATYMHGPLLPKNPMLCDYILSAALKQKYDDFDVLQALDDTLEKKANSAIQQRFVK